MTRSASLRGRRARTAVAAVVGSLVVAAGPASAMPPPDILGTWTGFSDNTAIQLVITAGGSRSGICTPITGSMTVQQTGAATRITGFYCPRTGRFNFLRLLGSPSGTIQAYVGNASEVGNPIKPPNFLTGTFGQQSTGTGSLELGEYSFFVRR